MGPWGRAGAGYILPSYFSSWVGWDCVLGLFAPLFPGLSLIIFDLPQSAFVIPPHTQPRVVARGGAELEEKA